MYGLIAGVVLLLVSIYYFRRSKYNLPPGPWGLPFIGVAHKLDPTGTHKTFTEWSKKYGDVFMMKMFGEDFVVLNSYDTVFKALVTEGDDYAGRPQTFRWRMIYNFCDGVIFSSGKKWAFLKKVAMQTLKMYGENLLTLEKISLETLERKEKELNIAVKEGKLVDIGSLLQACGAEIITSILYGKAVDPDLVVDFLDHQQVAIERTKTGFALDLLPILRYFPLQEDYRLSLQVQDKMKRIYKGEIKKARESYEPGNPKCFFHGLFEYQEKNNGNPNRTFDLTEDDLYALNADMIQAGVVTTTVTLKSMMAILVNHPDVQNKMAAEIEKVVGERQPRLEDREKMNYCEAVIQETLRYHTMLPLNVLHVPIKDKVMNGYDIPKGTRVFTNLWKLNHDDDFWDDPWVFRPERFLDQDGHMVPVDHPSRKRVLAFGTGRRICIGQALARNRLYLVITSLIQHFHFLPESETKRPKHDPRDYENRYNTYPKPYLVYVKSRN